MQLYFSKPEIQILNDMANIQINSYKQIISEDLLNKHQYILDMFGSSLEQAIREAHWRIKEYENLFSEPHYLGIIEDSELSTMRHILFHMEVKYIKKYGETAVFSLWSKFFEIEAFRKPKLLIGLTIKNQTK
jgi:hypothetical protein